MSARNIVLPNLGNAYGTLLDAFDEAVSRFSALPCITFMGKTVDYRYIQTCAKGVAAYLIRSGIDPGDRVMIRMLNCPQFIIAYFGCLYAGAIAVPYSPTSTEFELAKKIQEYEVRKVITLDFLYGTLWEAYNQIGETKLRNGTVVARIPEFLLSENTPKFVPSALSRFSLLWKTRSFHNAASRAEQEKEECPIDDKTCQQEAENKAGRYREREKLFRKSRQALAQDHDKVVSFREIMRTKISKEEEREMARRRPSAFDIAHILSTGGTTGMKKGVEFTHESVACNVFQCLEHWNIQYGGKKTFVAVLPPDHMLPLHVSILAPLFSGNRIVMVLDGTDLPSVKEVLASEKHMILVGVPALYRALAHSHRPNEDWSGIDEAICGGAPLDASDYKSFNEAVGKGVLFQGGGATETGVVACHKPGENKPDSIGKPLPGVEIRIVVEEESGREAAIGERGRILVRTPAVMSGYWRNPEATATVLKDGWFLMSDIGHRDADGDYYMDERLGDVIVVGNGRKIHPNDIVRSLREHPAVLEASVFGVPAGTRQEVVAHVSLKKGFEESDALARELQQWVIDRQGYFESPRVVRFRKEEFPRTPKREISRQALIQEELALRAKS